MAVKMLIPIMLASVASAETLGDVLIAGIFKQKALPLDIVAAENEGWTQLSGCNAYGNRWRLGNRLTPTLMFGANGKIAGFQVVTNITTFPMYPLTNVRSNTFFEIPDSNDEERALSMYFSDPRDICTPTATQEGLGDRFWVRTGVDSQEANDFEIVPLAEQDLVDATPSNGYSCQGCAPSGFAFEGSPGMGRHYWRYLAKDQTCVNLGSMFLLYNGGRLNAFGVSLVGTNFLIPTEDGVRPERRGNILVSQEPSLFEFAQQNLSPIFVDQDANPTCLQSLNKFNASLPFGDITSGTMHVFFSDPFSITCSPRPVKGGGAGNSTASPSAECPKSEECADCTVEIVLLLCGSFMFIILIFVVYRVAQRRTRAEMENSGEAMMASFAN
eukprot:TRINITY_DN3129_c4_g2_i1.p1 TRINITY_DN3129_c4_g2~~TRINITY_DN3129_c4_g2_i1.p1  ORF type:complete len:410 (+),score=70.94 TRINITY_DN3129_c4_g2_i1:73-1230(+)